MASRTEHPIRVDRDLLIIGAGNIGLCVLDILDREFIFNTVTVLDAEETKNEGDIPEWAVFHKEELKESNYQEILSTYLKVGDVCMNVCVLESMDLLIWCQENDVLYLDTSGEEWEEDNEDCITVKGRNKQEYLSLNGIHRRMASFVKKMNERNPSKTTWPTAVLYHGMNPGMVNHCMKRGLMDLADNVLNLPDVENRTEILTAVKEQNFALLAYALGVKIVHVAERDSQISSRPRYPGEFASTWSVDGFIQELQMYSELTLGTHERMIPANATHWKDGPHSVALGSKGANTRIFSWVPSGPTLGYLTTHDEVLTMGEFLTIRDDDGNLRYRPTVLFSYMPCDLSIASIHEFIMNGYKDPKEVFLDGKDIIAGRDEVGILLLGHRLGGWWTGSTMSIEDAKKIAPDRTPTTIQVVSGIIGSLHWLLRNPNEGICKPEKLPHEEVFAKAMPYLEPFVSVQSNFDPLDHPLLHFYDYENTFGSINKKDWIPDEDMKWQLPVLLQGPNKLIPSPYYVPESSRIVESKRSNGEMVAMNGHSDMNGYKSNQVQVSFPEENEVNDNKVVVAECKLGKGIFAAKDLAPGEKIIQFRGPKITLSELSSRKGKDRGNPLQIGRKLYIDLEAPCVYGNHSCEPNAIIMDSLILVARRSIRKGEEILYDYSTTMNEDDWTMDCCCESRYCRRIVLDFFCLPQETMKEYLREGGVLAHVAKALRREEDLPFDLDEVLEEDPGINHSADDDISNQLVIIPDKLGLIAAADIAPGERILQVLKGNIYTGDECDNLSSDSILFEVGRNLYADFKPPFCHIRHCCDPNAGVTKDEFLIARKPIKQGEEITWDESTCMSGYDDEWGFECECGSPLCRQIVLDMSCLPLSQRKKYLDEGIVFSHVVEALSNN